MTQQPGHHCTLPRASRTTADSNASHTGQGTTDASDDWVGTLPDLFAQKVFDFVEELIGGAKAADVRLVGFVACDNEMCHSITIVLVPAHPQSYC